MKLLKIQPEVNGEWFAVGILHDVISTVYITIYDTSYEPQSVTIGFMHRFIPMSDSEAETLIEFGALPLLELQIRYPIHGTKWVIKLGSNFPKKLDINSPTC